MHDPPRIRHHPDQREDEHLAEVINLRQFRKRKERAENAQKGTEKARLFGRSKTERQQEDHTAQNAERHLDQHLREREE